MHSTAQLIPHHSKVIQAKSCPPLAYFNLSPDLEGEFHDDGDDSSDTYVLLLASYGKRKWTCWFFSEHCNAGLAGCHIRFPR